MHPREPNLFISEKELEYYINSYIESKESQKKEDEERESFFQEQYEKEEKEINDYFVQLAEEIEGNKGFTPKPNFSFNSN